MAGGARRESDDVCKQAQAAIARALIEAFWMRNRSHFFLRFRIVGARPNAAFPQRAGFARQLTRHRSASIMSSCYYDRRGCAKKIQSPVHGSRCDARSRPRTTRIVRGHHDYGSEWSLLAAGRGHLSMSCLSAALGARGRQWITAEAP